MIAPEERRRHHFGDISNVRFTKTRQRYLIKLMMSTINFIYLGISGSMSESWKTGREWFFFPWETWSLNYAHILHTFNSGVPNVSKKFLLIFQRFIKKRWAGYMPPGAPFSHKLICNFRRLHCFKQSCRFIYSNFKLHITVPLKYSKNVITIKCNKIRFDGNDYPVIFCGTCNYLT